MFLDPAYCQGLSSAVDFTYWGYKTPVPVILFSCIQITFEFYSDSATTYDGFSFKYTTGAYLDSEMYSLISFIATGTASTSPQCHRHRQPPSVSFCIQFSTHARSGCCFPVSLNSITAVFQQCFVYNRRL